MFIQIRSKVKKYPERRNRFWPRVASNVKVVNKGLGFSFLFFLFYFSFPFSIYFIFIFIFIFIILDLGKEVWCDVITSFSLTIILYGSAHNIYLWRRQWQTSQVWSLQLSPYMYLIVRIEDDRLDIFIFISNFYFIFYFVLFFRLRIRS